MNIENVKDFISRNSTEFTLVFVIAVIWGALGLAVPVFLSYPNFFQSGQTECCNWCGFNRYDAGNDCWSY